MKEKKQIKKPSPSLHLPFVLPVEISVLSKKTGGGNILLILVCFRALDGGPDHFAFLNFNLSLF
jgi:hypothetical protein